MARQKFRTLHAAEYRAARIKSRKTDERSLAAHWDEGRVYARYGEPIQWIAADVEVSWDTVHSHIKLYDMFETDRELQAAARKWDTYSYIELMRLHSGLGHSRRSPAVPVWQCMNCGSRALVRVNEDEADAELAELVDAVP